MAFDPAISLALKLALAILLGASALHKVGGLARMATAIDNYQLAPQGAGRFLAAPLALAEGALAFLLLSPFASGAALVAAALFLIYGAAIGANIARGRANIDCGCSFGPPTERLTPALIVRNAALVIAALIVAAPASSRTLGVFDFASAAFFAIGAAAIYMTADKLFANAARMPARERAA